MRLSILGSNRMRTHFSRVPVVLAENLLFVPDGGAENLINVHLLFPLPFGDS